MAVKNIIIINDGCGLNGGGGPKVSTQEANWLCQFYNVFYFCGNVISKDGVDPRIHIVSLYDKPLIKSANRFKALANNIFSFKARRSIKKLLKDFSPSDTVVHMHGFVANLSSSIFKPIYQSGIPFFYTCHAYHLICSNGGLFDFKKKKICNLKPNGCACHLRNCDSRNIVYKLIRNIRQNIQTRRVKLGKNHIHYIFISDTSENALLKYLKPQASYRMIHNPVEQGKTDIKDIQNNKKYLFVGRVQEEKGIEELCASAEKKGISLTVVGDGALLPSLKEKYASYPSIEFCGWQNYAFISERMRESRALIFSSIWYECEPLTILEAKSIGLPVICSSLCAGKENLTEKSGIIYNPYDYSSFSAAIDKMNDQNSIQDYSANSKKEFEEYIQKNRHFEQLVSFYNNVLEENAKK